MAQDVATAIVQLKSAHRGPAGTVEMLQAARMAFRPTIQRRLLRGRKMDSAMRTTYAEVIIAIETTNVTEYHKHLVQADEEKLIVVFEAFNGDITRTYYRVQAEDGGDSQFPPPEEGGDAPRHELRFRLLEKTEGAGEGLDTAFDDAGPT